jgi:hypothetical protein
VEPVVKIEIETNSHEKKDDRLNDSLEGAEEDNDFEAFSQSAMKWSQTIRKNNVLLHLDLSYNNFKKADVTHMNEGLRRNHSIMGLHFSGNDGTVDELGFVHPGKVFRPGEAMCYQRIPRKFLLFA